MNYFFPRASGILTGFIALILVTTGFSQTKSQEINVSKDINTKVIAEALNDKVNSAFVEEGPMLTKDGELLYFSRSGHPKNMGGVHDQDIWLSRFDSETQSWQEATNLGAPLNNKGPNFICGVGWKGDTVLLGNVYGTNGKMTGGISISVKVGEKWSTPTTVFINNDYNISDRVAYDLSHTRGSMIIAEEKADSRGKLDLYVSFRDKKAKNMYTATESINLGPVINSTGNESSPFLSYDGKTLFFASDGHKGYGKEDIFFSRRLDNTWTKWSVPENMGEGINTQFNDSYFGFTPTSRFAYYSRGLSPTNSDIYRVEMTYLFDNPEALLKDSTSATKLLEMGKINIAKNVFDDDKAIIKDESMGDLEAIFNYLERYKTMTVLISTHSNKHDTRNESFTLSNKRIEAIRDYLVKRGIEKSRLNYQGYGHDVLVNTTDPIVKKYIASSVEFKFVNYGR